MSRRKVVHKGADGASNRSKMPLVALGLLLVGGLIAILFSRSGGEEFVPEVTGGPRLQVDTELVDHGDVKLGTTIQSVFKVKNVGDSDLIIQGEPAVELLEGC